MTEERLLEILKECSTPLYLFDGEILNRRVEHLRKSLPSSVRLCYAVKAAWWNGWRSAPRENFGSASGWGCLGKNS